MDPQLKLLLRGHTAMIQLVLVGSQIVFVQVQNIASINQIILKKAIVEGGVLTFLCTEMQISVEKCTFKVKE